MDAQILWDSTSTFLPSTIYCFSVLASDAFATAGIMTLNYSETSNSLFIYGRMIVRNGVLCEMLLDTSEFVPRVDLFFKFYCDKTCIFKKSQSCAILTIFKCAIQ